jgi:hypothetical protein
MTGLLSAKIQREWQTADLEHAVILLADACTLDRGRNKAFKERWKETQEPEDNTML